MSQPQVRVLVVDDDVGSRSSMALYLRSAHFDVKTAGDGEKALRALADHEFDIVLLDLNMPTLDGMSVLQIVRGHYSPSVLPIIITTANNASSVLARAMDLGANDYVNKPLDPTELLARIKHHVRMKTAVAEVTGVEPAVTTLGIPRSEQVTGPVEVGTVLGGKYKLVKVIGTGGYGTVYRAEHLGLGSSVAVKVMASAGLAGDEALARFQREGTILGRMNHPNVVHVFDIDSRGDSAYMVMELLTGGTLTDEVHKHKMLTPLRAAEIAITVCAVLYEAHSEGLVHRDIKPDNIFLHRERGRETIKVLDFGIAKFTATVGNTQNLTREGTVVGTPAFMSPERLSGAALEPRSDVYSVGVMLYYMLTGVHPFTVEGNELLALGIKILSEEPEPIRNHRPEIGEVLAQVVHNAMAKSPRVRPTADLLASQLARSVGVDSLAATTRSGGKASMFDALLRAVRDMQRKQG